MKADFLWECIDPDLDGFFTRLESLGVPWADTLSGETLDDIYLGTYSGGKPPSPLVKRWVTENEGKLTDVQMSRIAVMAQAINGQDWARLWLAEIAEYNPISNYDMREELEDDTKEKTESGTSSTAYGKTDTRTDNLTTTYGTNTQRTDNLTDGHGETVTRTDDLTDGYADTVTRTDNLQTARTGTDSTQSSSSTESDTTSAHSVYGLNSSAAVPSDTDTTGTDASETGSETVTHNTIDTQTGTQATAHTGSTTHTGTQATAHTGTDTHTGTQTTAKTGSDTHTGTQTDATTGTDSVTDSRTSSESHSYVLTRSGNIGVTTAQDMLTQERTLRAWRLFYDRVFPDLDRLLTLCTY